MKTLISFALLGLSSMAFAQEETSKISLASLNHLVGQWEGTGWATSPNGTRNTFDQTENIQSKLNGSIMLVEGMGKNSGTDEVAFEALALFSYDSANQSFAIRSHLASGESTDAIGHLEGDLFIWQFEVPAGTIRYTLTADETKWNEYGEFSPDGQQWYKFMEMNLTKISK